MIAGTIKLLNSHELLLKETTYRSKPGGDAIARRWEKLFPATFESGAILQIIPTTNIYRVNQDGLNCGIKLKPIDPEIIRSQRPPAVYDNPNIASAGSKEGKTTFHRKTSILATLKFGSLKKVCNLVLMKGRKQNVWIKVSPVQKEIATMLSEGLTASEIADRRKRSQNTIRSMIRSMLNRYDAKNATQLVAEFLRKGIIK